MIYSNSLSSFPKSLRKYCLPSKYGLDYCPCPAFGDMLFPVVNVKIGNIWRPGMVSTLFGPCILNSVDGQLAGFIAPNLGTPIKFLGGDAFEKEIEMEISLIGEIRTLAIMSAILPRNCFPILGQALRETMNFSIVENFNEYPQRDDFPLNKRIFFKGNLKERTGKCPYYLD